MFIFLVFVSVAISIVLDSKNDQKDKNFDKEIKKYVRVNDSLKLIVAQQYDTLKSMSLRLQSSFDKSLKYVDSTNKILELNERPQIKVIECKVSKTGTIELILANDGKHSATNFNSRYYFITKALYDNSYEIITDKSNLLSKDEIFSEKDIGMKINIPKGIFNVSDYIYTCWIYFYIQINYSDLLSYKKYPYEYSMRLRSQDDGVFNPCNDYEHLKLKEIIKKKL